MSEKIHVDKVASLLLYLSERLPGWARSTLKERLKKGLMQQLFPSSNEQMDLNHG